MLVSVVTPDLSHNCLGRAYVLAQLVERNHDVEIVGPELKDGVWEPIKDEYDYRGVKTGARIYQFSRAIPDLIEKISGDVIYVSKPRAESYGVSLLAQLGRDRPLILDIDDWETGFSYVHGRLKTCLVGVPRLININSFYYKMFFEAISGVADAQTVSNQFLKNRFGGTLVPHVRDTDELDPSRFTEADSREKLNLPSDEFIVMFSGTPRPHKGVDDLARAVAAIDLDDISAVVVGGDESEYVDQIRQVGGDSITVYGMQPFDELPMWVSAADVVAIPQRDTPATRGQLPAKVFDAMAMAKPIIATGVNDLSVVLDGCGRIIEPDDVGQLQRAIIELYNDPELRNELGEKARKRCVEKYSYDALSPVVDEIISDVC